ncbi:MAG: stage sporulation protein [Paenibacillus sp.]|jgi:stage II sporulation protein P|nr:stage sporulation protein [Paenibacillus sp.]
MKGEPYTMKQWMKLIHSADGETSALRRLFAAYIGISLLLVLLAAASAGWQAYTTATPKAAMIRMADSVPAQFFIDLLGLEAAPLARDGASTFSGGNIGQYVLSSLLHIDHREPRSLLASELPAMRGTTPSGGADRFALLPDTGEAKLPDTVVYTPVVAIEEQQPSVQPQLPAAPSQQPPTPPASAPSQTDAAPSEPAAAVKLTTDGRKVVFIYHSHPRESWAPELKVTQANEAEDSRTNITLVGKRLMEKLEEQGVGAQQSNIDYPTKVQGYNWNYSYKYSLQTVKEAMVGNKDITYLFDIHRDSASRDITTATIGGLDYAKVYFIVGKKNERWEQNEAFATKIHEKLAADYPGLSRGIWDKGTGGHAEYNQSVSPNSILIEVGGPYNTLEETYRTADALAKTIASLYWDAEKVNANGNAPQAVKK